MTMLTNPSGKYRPFPQIDLPGRQWPGRTITHAPRWLSTDLRDGNQSLIDPMGAEKKTRFFELLLKVGLKEIEVGFPAAGATEFDFISGLVRSGSIPDDVLVQVLTQSREDLIKTSFESLEGAKAAIVHLYNAVSPLWRQVVFGLERPQIRDIAVSGAKVLRDQAARFPGTDWHFEYQPRNLLHRRTRFQHRMLRGGDAGARAHARASDHPQSAGHRRGGDAQHLCRPDRIFLPQPAEPRERGDLAAYP